MLIGITGIDGFLGWHLRAYLLANKFPSVLGADRKTFNDPKLLQEFVHSVDVIIHLAGMNRGTEVDIERTNITITEKLIYACTATNSHPHVIFANSIQAGRHEAYERSKQCCAELLQKWANTGGGVFTNVILPNVFGEGGKPFYNSVVATFCQQLTTGENARIMEDRCLEMIHAQDVARIIAEKINCSDSEEVRVKGCSLYVSELLSKLQKVASDYREQLIPDLSDPLTVNLFNTYRSYLFPHQYPVSLSVKADLRGSLFEAVKTSGQGQCFLSTTKSGVTRGNHFHTKKFERFLVLAGHAIIRLRKLFSQSVVEFSVKGDVPQYIDIPTFYTHDITNVGTEDLLTLFWSNEIFDPNVPDTIQEPVLV